MLPNSLQSLDVWLPIRKSDSYKNPPNTRTLKNEAGTWKDLIRKLHRISRSSGIGPWNNSMSSFKLYFFTCIINYYHFHNTVTPPSRIRQCNWRECKKVFCNRARLNWIRSWILITIESCLFSTGKAVCIYSGCFRKTPALARAYDRALWGHGGGSEETRPQNSALHPSRADGGVKEYRAKIKQNSPRKDTTSCAHTLQWDKEAICCCMWELDWSERKTKARKFLFKSNYQIQHLFPQFPSHEPSCSFQILVIK